MRASKKQVEPLVQKLVNDGWTEYPDGLRKYARCFYKRFDTSTRCRCNDDKDGMQVCCAVSEFQGRMSYELYLCGELHDGTWIELHQWVMPEDIEKGLAMIPRMLSTWEHIANMRAIKKQQEAAPLTLQARFEAAIKAKRFGALDVRRFKEQPRLALLAGAEIGYALALQDVKDALQKQ